MFTYLLDHSVCDFLDEEKKPKLQFLPQLHLSSLWGLHCVNQIRMKPIAFHHLCHILTKGEHVRPTIHMSVMEQVLIFLHIIGHNVRFRVIGSQIYRSTETVHRYFKVVLRVVLKLYRALIRLHNEDTPPEIRNSRRFYLYFKVNIATCVFFKL